MVQKHIRPRDRRFIGKAHEWQITCPQCQAVSKTIKPGQGRSMPPEWIVKKLKRMGWQVGDKPKQDLCPDCIRKPIKSRTDTAAKALRDIQAPVVTVNGTPQHFANLKVAASQLDPAHAKELIELLRQQIPPRPPRKPKAEPPPKMEQAEYENWLHSLDDQS